MGQVIEFRSILRGRQSAPANINNPVEALRERLQDPSLTAAERRQAIRAARAEIERAAKARI